MDAFEICALIFAILLCLLTAPNILFSYSESIAELYLNPASIIDNLAVSIVIMVGACCRLSAGIYKVCMIILIITDGISFVFMLSIYRRSLISNLVKLINIAIITPLIIFIDKIKKKREMIPMINPEIATGFLIVEQNDSLPNNNKPDYVQKQKPNVSNAYPPSS